MDVDAALMQAWNLGMDDAGWSDAVMDEADQLLPILVDAGYAATDDVAHTWWFTPEGVARAEQLELAADSSRSAQETRSGGGRGVALREDR